MGKPTSGQQRVRRLAVPAGAAVLLLLAAGLAGFGTLGLTARDEEPLFGPLELTPRGAAPDPGAPDGATPEASGSEEPTEGLAWIGDALLVVAAVVGLVLLVLLVRALRRAWTRRAGWRGGRLRLRPLPAHPAPAAPAEQDRRLLAALDAGLVDLSDDDRDPRRAVIACWLRLEEVAAAAGVPRHTQHTAGDLVVRLLRTRRVSESLLAELVGVFRQARFGSHAVDERMRTTARTALRRLREELGAPVPGGTS